MERKTMIDINGRSALCKLQDQIIIKSAAETQQKIGRAVSHKSMKWLTELSLSQEEQEALKSNPDVNFPVVFTEAIRKEQGIDSFFIYPEKEGKLLKLQDWINYWIPFQFLNFFDKDDKILSNHISRALAFASRTYNERDCQSLIDQLWKHRFIYNAYKCAEWRLIALAHSEEEFQDIILNGNEAERAFAEVETQLNKIKEEVQSLDEWVENLYLLIPLVKYTLRLHYSLNSASEEIKKRTRFIDEVSADIHAIFFAKMLTGISMGMENPWSATHIHKNKVSSEQLPGVKRNLSYHYRARVFFPKFWFEKAVSFLESDSDSLPISLNEYDQRHLASCWISYLPDDAHISFSTVSSSEITNTA
jgi:hypothetical protein